jgi:hypothetical protein
MGHDRPSPIPQPKVMGSKGYRPWRVVQEGSALLGFGAGRPALFSVQAIAVRHTNAISCKHVPKMLR